MIILLEIQAERSDARDKKWYNENYYYQYHHQRGHTTGKCRTLQHKVQDWIDQGRL